MVNKRSIIIIATLLGLAIIAMAIVGFTNQRSTNTPTGTYVDPGSGETIIDSDTSSQGPTASLKNTIIYPGFSRLIDRGLSPDQVQSVQLALAEYSFENKKNFKEVSLTVDSIRHLLPQGTSTQHTLTFDITVNRKDKYFMSVAYSDTATCVTKLYAADKTTLLIER
jgi:hypothetical protein